MEFTKDQRKIIDARNCNLLVSAAAGSGKTAVLVERILQLITDEDNPVDIDTLLVVTFTRAAAAQMRDKISDAIGKRLEKAPGNVNLQRQAALVHNAQITTIDSFCQYILRNSFADIGLEPNFRLADEGEMKLIVKDTLDKLIEDYYAKNDEEFIYMAESLAYGSADDSIEEIILNLFEIAMSDPWPRQWLIDHQYDYEPKLEGEWYKALLNSINATLVQCKGLLSSALKLTEKSAGPYMYGDRISAEIDLFDAAIKYMDSGEQLPVYDELRARIDNICFDRLPPCKDDSVDVACKEKVAALRNEAKEILGKLNKNYFARSENSIMEQMKRCNRVLCKLIEATLLFCDRLDENKKEKGVLSFADCEHLALNILVGRNEDHSYFFTETAKEYRKHFSYVMIDEYQDSNLIQELILASVSGECEGIYNRFMVGDLKQSIYRFRQADPSIFIEKYNQYDENSSTHMVVDLHQNFRSRKQVLDATNGVFSQIMSACLGGVDYDDKAALYLGANYPEPEDEAYTSEFIIYELEEEDELSTKELEAKGIATKIEELMLTTKVAVGGQSDGLRSLKYGDIVILLRAANSDADIYKKALERRGIPVHVSGSEGYFSTYEIQTLLHLLRIIDNPLQDISFYGVLSSPIGGLTPEDIATVRIGFLASLGENSRTEEGYLYKACQYVTSVTEHNGLYDKIKTFLDMLNKYRKMAEYMSVAELLSTILEDTHYRAIVSAMRAGEKRLANVDMLIRKASDYSNTSYFGLYNFLRYIDVIKKYEVDMAEAETIDENADVVRIMSIHKSKGLEFPVCILAGMGKQFNKMDIRKSIVIDHELGIGMKDVDPVRRLQSGTLRRLAIIDRISVDTIAEEMRILYVAMTRAKEKLLITAAFKDPEDKIINIQDKVSDGINTHLLANAKGYFEWLFMILADTNIHVPISLSIINKEQIEADELAIDVDYELLAKTLKESELSSGIGENLQAENEYIDKLFSRKYPFENLAGLYTKTSVSELKHAAMPEEAEASFNLINSNVTGDEDEELDIVPQFISGTGDKPGATLRGSAFHRIMELLDFDKWIHDIEDNGLHNFKDKISGISLHKIEELLIHQMDEFVNEGSFTSEHRRIFDNQYNRKLLINLLSNPLMLSMAKAQQENRLFKEAPFMMGLPASLLDPKYPSEETVLIQGIIDVYWIEEDGAVILDYKTDKVNSASRLVELYKTQLDYYEQALNKMNVPVKEKLIYSFSLNEVIKL